MLVKTEEGMWENVKCMAFIFVYCKKKCKQTEAYDKNNTNAIILKLISKQLV